MTLSKLIQTDIFKFLSLYFLSNFFLLINFDALYWDDWEIYNQNYQTINAIFSEVIGNASYLVTEIHYNLLNIGNGIFIYRFLTFLLLFMNGIFVYHILKTITIFNSRDIFYLVAFFLIAPVFSSKIALINFPYTLFSFIFFLAFYLLAKNIKGSNIILRVIILLLFFVSFLINSLLVFYAIPLIYIFYVQYFSLSIEKAKKIKFFIMQNLDYIILPIIFYIIKLIYFAPDPNGQFVTYNQITLYSLLKAPILVLFTFFTSFIEPLYATLFPWGIFIFISLYAGYKFTSNFNTNLAKNRPYVYSNFLLLELGLLFFFLGVFAYCAVGKIGNADDWNSRFQLLVPLGFSFILVYLVFFIAARFKLSSNMQAIIFITLIISFVGKNLYDGYKYNLDWFYIKGIQENMRSNDTIKNHSTFIVSLESNNYIANNRIIRFYEYNSLMKNVFDDEKRLMVNSLSELEKSKQYQQNKQTYFSSWKESMPIDLTIAPVSNIGHLDIVKLFIYRFIDYKRFTNMTKKLVIITVKDKNIYKVQE